jgi:hypothetical protein
MSSGRWTLSDSDLFSRYVEALSALSSVESLQRDALRKAVESANAVETQAKTQMADQQRMYDRTSRDAHDTERLLAELRSMLGTAATPPIALTPPTGTPPQLVQIRGQIRDVAQWATDTKPTVESLLRTRDRLAKTPQPVLPTPAPKPTPVVPAPPKKLAVGVIAAIAALVIIVVIVIVLTAH